MHLNTNSMQSWVFTGVFSDIELFDHLTTCKVITGFMFIEKEENGKSTL
jgi:hypothetical protein